MVIPRFVIAIAVAPALLLGGWMRCSNRTEAKEDIANDAADGAVCYFLSIKWYLDPMPAEREGNLIFWRNYGRLM